jgi:hypothetical protein
MVWPLAPVPRCVGRVCLSCGAVVVAILVAAFHFGGCCLCAVSRYIPFAGAGCRRWLLAFTSCRLSVAGYPTVAVLSSFPAIVVSWLTLTTCSSWPRALVGLASCALASGPVHLLTFVLCFSLGLLRPWSCCLPYGVSVVAFDATVFG